MLLLVNTTDKVQLITSAAATVDVHASFADFNSSFATSGLGKQNTAIVTATTTDIVAAPGASTTRNVKTLHIRNKDASLACDVTVVYDQNGTDFELHKTTLKPGEALEYIEGIGFFTLAAAVVGQSIPIVKALSGDQSNSTTTLTEVTGLSVLTGVGTYVFDYFILAQAAAATTGLRFSVNHDGTVTAFVANILWGTNIATASDDVNAQAHVAAAAAVYSTFSARAKSTLGWGTTTDVDAAASDLLVKITGMMIVTVDGNIELWHGSEVAAASTVKAGSSLILTKTG